MIQAPNLMHWKIEKYKPWNTATNLYGLWRKESIMDKIYCNIWSIWWQWRKIKIYIFRFLERFVSLQMFSTNHSICSIWRISAAEYICRFYVFFSSVLPYILFNFLLACIAALNNLNIFSMPSPLSPSHLLLLLVLFYVMQCILRFVLSVCMSEVNVYCCECLLFSMCNVDVDVRCLGDL